MAAFKVFALLAPCLATLALAESPIVTLSSTTKFNGTGNGIVTVHVTMTDDDPTTTIFGGGNGGNGPHNVGDGHPADVTVTEFDAPLTGVIPTGLHPTGSHHIDGIVTITAPVPKSTANIAATSPTLVPKISGPSAIDSAVHDITSAGRPDMTKAVSELVSIIQSQAEAAVTSLPVPGVPFDATNPVALHSFIEGLISSESKLALGHHSKSAHHASSAPANLASSLSSKSAHATARPWSKASQSGASHPASHHWDGPHSHSHTSQLDMHSKSVGHPSVPHQPSYYPDNPSKLSTSTSCTTTSTSHSHATVPEDPKTYVASSYEPKVPSYQTASQPPVAYQPPVIQTKPAPYPTRPSAYSPPPVYPTLTTHVKTTKIYTTECPVTKTYQSGSSTWTRMHMTTTTFTSTCTVCPEVPTYAAPKPAPYPSQVPGTAPPVYAQPTPSTSALPPAYTPHANHTAPSIYPKPAIGPYAKPMPYPGLAPQPGSPVAPGAAPTAHRLPLVSQIPDGQVQASPDLGPISAPRPATYAPSTATGPSAPLVSAVQSVGVQMQRGWLFGIATTLISVLLAQMLG